MNGQSQLHTVAIIPARMGSSRFPGKPLADICGEAMIYHVYKRCEMAAQLQGVYIATCDEDIRSYCVKKCMNVVMTKNTHERCSDRVAEAMLTIEKETKSIDIVVMVQGDEPMVTAEMINDAIAPLLSNASVDIVNLMAPMKSKSEHEDPNEVKVVVDQKGDALYFSREPIPSRKKGAHSVPMYKQVCIIPFRRDFLLKFNQLTPTPLEAIESVDMLRVLEHGYSVRMVETSSVSYSVDTKEDLIKVRECMQHDALTKMYLKEPK